MSSAPTALRTGEPTSDALRSLLAEAIATHDVPGAVVAVLHNERIHEAAAGIASTDTRIEATPQTLFPFGSVSKMLTATLTMHLVSEGQIGLEDPIMQYVPEFAPPDPRASRVTIRQLLSHSGGLVGTVFVDTGRGADAVARGVTALSEHALYFDPGTLLSYCNSGLVLLGRMIERVTGAPWDQALADRLVAPLGSTTLVSLPESAIRHRTSVGHILDATGTWRVDPRPFFLPGHGPAGSTPMGTARDLLSLVQLHLRDGLLATGERYLHPELARTMRTVHSASPAAFLQAGWGLGWATFDWGDRRIIGHDGATLGSTAYLRVDPERGFAVALLVNAPLGLPVYEQVVGTLFRELAGCWEPMPATLPEVDRDLVAPYLGTYEDIMYRHELKFVDGQLQMHSEPPASNRWRPGATRIFRLEIMGDGQFVARGENAMAFTGGRRIDCGLTRPIGVFTAPDGAQYLHTAAHSFRRLTG